MLVYLRGLGISEIRYLFFHDPIWMRLKNSGSFTLGRCRGRRTSRQDRRSTHVNDASVPRCRTFCSRPRLQFVRGCPKRPWCDMYSRYNGGSFSCFFPLFLFFSSAGSSKKNARYSRKTYCLLLLAVFLLLNFRSFSRFFLRQSVCTRAAWWLWCINEAAYYLK